MVSQLGDKLASPVNMEGATLLAFVLLIIAVESGTLHTDETTEDGIPRMISSSRPLRIREGESIELPCKAVNINGKVRVWKKLPSRTLFSGSISVSRDARIQLLEGSTLKLEDIIPEYSGEYICQISHQPLLNVTYKIQVLVPPTIIPDPAHGKAIVRKGNPVTLLCDVQGSPKPIVTWTYDQDGESTSTLPSGVRQVHGTQLQVASVDVHHSGIYKCTADNDVGDPVSATFNMTILYAPEVTVTPEWIHGDEMVTVEFTCTSHSMPMSQVHWVRGVDPKQGQHLKSNQYLKITDSVVHPTTTESRLKVQNMRREDLGSYTCVAKNSVGVTFKKVEVSGLAEPVQLRGMESGDSSFQLLWTAKSYSPVMEYQLKIRKHKSGDAWTDVVIPVSDDAAHQSLFFSQSYNVTGLDPGFKYEAVLQAHNDHGWNRPSDTLLFNVGPTPEPDIEEPIILKTVIPFYDADLDVTDPTFLKQDSSSSSSSYSSSLFILSLTFIFCLA
ncbi:hypothetical protein JTE90_004951 [Oedothorax gibbosus]|uniref:Uncharacterized protein n=1 Tax=Oedothorax gibbosus TaxID=931172 RepID=A0AAV6VAQ4_9ARAC|nr:hypothetical protein JTE90_004951 [Oedothorax gibbosus]